MNKPNRGDRLDIRAKDWGDMLTVMERFRTGEIKFDAPALESTLRSATTVKMLNDSGGPLSQCAVVGLGEPVITPDLNEQEFIGNFAFRTVAPMARKWGILQTPCPASEIATAVIAGFTPCKINVDSEVLPVNFVSLGSNQLVPSYGSGDA